MLVNGRAAAKPSVLVGDDSVVEVSDEERVLKYAGRGGYKLEGALNASALK